METAEGKHFRRAVRERQSAASAGQYCKNLFSRLPAWSEELHRCAWGADSSSWCTEGQKSDFPSVPVFAEQQATAGGCQKGSRRLI